VYAVKHAYRSYKSRHCQYFILLLFYSL